jgi:hypothetical protein
MKGEMKNSITLLSPVLISAVTAIPGWEGNLLISDFAFVL